MYFLCLCICVPIARECETGEQLPAAAVLGCIQPSFDHARRVCLFVCLFFLACFFVDLFVCFLVYFLVCSQVIWLPLAELACICFKWLLLFSFMFVQLVYWLVGLDAYL